MRRSARGEPRARLGKIRRSGKMSGGNRGTKKRPPRAKGQVGQGFRSRQLDGRRGGVGSNYLGISRSRFTSRPGPNSAFGIVQEIDTLRRARLGKNVERHLPPWPGPLGREESAPVTAIVPSRRGDRSQRSRWRPMAAFKFKEVSRGRGPGAVIVVPDSSPRDRFGRRAGFSQELVLLWAGAGKYSSAPIIGP